MNTINDVENKQKKPPDSRKRNLKALKTTAINNKASRLLQKEPEGLKTIHTLIPSF